MGVYTYSEDNPSLVAPSRLFKALIEDSQTIIPKLLPQVIKSITFLEGDGAVGSIRLITFHEGSNMKCVKNRIDELDEEGLVCKYTMIEGEPLGERIESIAYEVKFGSGEGEEGCVCTVTSHYNAVGEYGIEEEEIEEGREKGMKIFGVVEAYLLENPLLYN
ncbi:Pathogenesis-related protein STH-21 [Linum perenne]